MVLPGDGDYMATRHERRKSLHNFTLSSWGSQQLMRCTKIESDGGSGAADQRLRGRPPPSRFLGATPYRFGGGDSDQPSDNRNRRTEMSRSAEDGVEEGIEEYREKIMSDLRALSDKITRSIFRKTVAHDEEEEEQNNDNESRKQELEPRKKERVVSPPEAPGVVVEVRPWNLRKRRADCQAPIPESRNCHANQYNYKGLGIIEEKRLNSWSLGKKSAISTRQNFTSKLSKKEIEDDYMEMMGHRPPRRPQKRHRTVQKHIDLLHPAYYFTEITQDLYKVPDAAANRKKR